MKRSLAAAAAATALRRSRPRSPASRRSLGVAPTLDRLRQLALLVCGEQGHEADFVEVLTNRITHDVLLNHR